MRKFTNAFLRRISSIYMNKVNHYGSEYYAHYIKHANAWYGFVMKSYYRYVADQCMIKPMNIPPKSRVLDIGCGVGLLVEQFTQLGYDTAGVDVHSAAIELSVCPERCFLATTTAQLNFPDRYFDLIVSREVLEHIPISDIDECIKEWNRIGNGKMVHFIAVTERGYSAMQDPTHVNIQTEAWWAEKFRSHGHKVLQPTNIPFSPFGTWGYLIMGADSMGGTST
jgi:2-polyprenyl-3-methyl-5-hydroxy-6-metoxy-1,4-benzoquinol methylase